jgi:general L-amino acid transport system substrate-binding protein
MKTLKILAAAMGAALALGAAGANATTLDTIKQRGQLICGSNPGLAGFGIPNDKGEWTGFDVDYCRAVSAAIFGDPTKVKFIPLSAKDRPTALQSGEIDVLIRNTTWT